METIRKTSFDRIYALQIINTVIKEGSFASAAKRLGTSPSNITKEVQKLENYLEVKIFKRSTRSLAVTQEGKIAIERSRKILSDLAELEDEVSGSIGQIRGHLRVTAPTTLGQSLIAEIIAEYQKQQPYLDIDLRLTDRILDPIEQDIDLSIRTAFQLKDSSLFVKKLRKLDRVIVASPAYLSHYKAPKNLDDLSNHNCLLYMRGDSPFIWSFTRGTKKRNVHIQGTYKSNNLFSLIKACEAGVGILNIPRYLVEQQINDGSLKVILKQWKLDAHNVFLLTTRRPSQSKRLNSLLEFLQEYF